MRELDRLFKFAKKLYDEGKSPLSELGEVTKHALKLLEGSSQDELPSESAGGKQYWIRKDGPKLSRPFLPGLLLLKPGMFEHEWQRLTAAINGKTHRIGLPEKAVNEVVYTAVMSFSLCYDLWKSSSRKTPGTQFEVVLGSLLGRLLPGYVRSKHIPLPEADSLSTDIVMTEKESGRALVFPAKITTRERIVQPFAHQRILDSVFGVGKYRSVLACVSEMQRDEESGANEICVPGTVRLFQRHLAPVAGMYYLDPPVRYLKDDLATVIQVGSVGKLLTKDLALLVSGTAQVAG